MFEPGDSVAFQLAAVGVRKSVRQKLVVAIRWGIGGMDLHSDTCALAKCARLRASNNRGLFMRSSIQKA